MIDNIIINKAFVPEYPGEWAGGLIQVNTKDIPSKDFFNIQIGTGFNTQTTGKAFYSDRSKGKTDWLGIDDGTRALPSSYTTKADFDQLSAAEKTAIGKQLRNGNNWKPVQSTAPLTLSFQVNGGFNTKVFGKIVGGTIGIIYNKTNKYTELLNRDNQRFENLNGQPVFSVNANFDDDKYQKDITVGAIGSFAVQLNSSNKVSLKTIVNVNSSNAVTLRQGSDFTRQDDIKGTEFTFKQNTFYTVQLAGEHNVVKPLKLKWYGAFNILDGYIPDQRRILYSRSLGSNDPYSLVASNVLSQQNGSRVFQNLNDYIYTAGGDLAYNFDVAHKKQTIKAGYMLQIKDRLYDGK
ncbi:MAG: hypothetical protein HY305_00520, partial [Sphingobacteriales bacterium]|nr:hypothetical protein [Sphingobacteriales bacterium]